MLTFETLLAEIKSKAKPKPPPQKVRYVWEETQLVLILTIKICDNCGALYECPEHVPFRQLTHPLLGEHFTPAPHFNPNVPSFAPRYIHRMEMHIPVCHQCLQGQTLSIEPPSPQRGLF